MELCQNYFKSLNGQKDIIFFCPYSKIEDNGII